VTASATAVPRAATVLFARGPGSTEGFLVRRAETLRFMGGFYAFPGGRALPGDADVAEGRDAVAVQRVAAVRELFEETGVLLARRPDGSFPTGVDLVEPRRELLAEPNGFLALLRRLGLAIRSDDLTHVGNLVTPPFSAVRFDTAFFTADLPSGQSPVVEAGELDAGEWLTADAALRGWEQGRMLISPPTVSLLDTIRGRPVKELAGRARRLFAAMAAGAPEVIYFSPFVQMMPLFCKGLPPTHYTNAFLVGRDPAYLIDPGPAEPGEQARLFTLLDARLAAGARMAGVLLTHHHPDHVGAAEAVARRHGVPVMAHPWTARALAGKVSVTREIGEGSALDLGVAPHGGPWRLEAMLTPGHAPGHLCFYEPTYRLLFVGDMASTISSVVITPPEGDITEYLESLRRLRALPARLLLPAHGSVSARPHFVIDEAVNHRRKREGQLVQALAEAPRRVAELAQDLYRGAPAEVMPYAEKQVLAGLLKLEREGRAAKEAAGDDPVWRVKAPDGA
jgi:glyoxylase-like metal-dependent hydrolase (beta-lactamase superfamily II)/8-oxo-dGTP pyrophosphatase MutT (NUDIX family)